MRSVFRVSAAAFALAFAVSGAACSSPTEEAAGEEDAITSNDGTVLELRFSTEVTAAADTPARQAILAQLQYVQGILTTDQRANAQVGLVELSNVLETPSGASKKITYSASLPVIWPRGTRVSTRYDLKLPRDVTKLDEFNAKYDGKCGTNEYGQETFWHDWNPKASGCRPGSEVLTARTSVRVHPQTTQGKLPEYNRIWEDDALDIVAVFGIISSNTPDDEGAREMQNVVDTIASSLTDVQRTENPTSWDMIRDVKVTGKLNVDGRERRVTLDAMLVQEVASTGPAFGERFGAASENADFIVYSGHSGLGKNINGLAERTRVKAGKYQLMYLNGCQTFAYLGNDLHSRKITANGAANDPRGTKDLDIVANALPAYGDNGDTIFTLYDAIRTYSAAPKTYNDLLRDFSSLHLVAVFGEEDNTFSR